MTAVTGKRALPHRPHPDHLRKQAKARLAELRAFRPDACLADAQRVLAQEYGFSSWGRLQAEVSLRATAKREWRFRFRRRRGPIALRYRERQVQEPLLEPAPQLEAPTAFLTGVATNVGVLFVLGGILVSVWLLFFSITG